MTTFRSLLATCVLCLSGCAQLLPVGWGWAGVVDDRQLDDPSRFAAAQDEARAAYEQTPGDRNRLRLAWLLSHPASPDRDLATSRALLEGVDPDSPYAPLRDLILRQVVLEDELGQARDRARAHAQALERLEAGQAAARTSDAELEAARRRAAELEAQVRDLKAQLDALRSIDADLAEKKKPPGGLLR